MACKYKTRAEMRDFVLKETRRKFDKKAQLETDYRKDLGLTNTAYKFFIGDLKRQLKKDGCNVKAGRDVLSQNDTVEELADAFSEDLGIPA